MITISASQGLQRRGAVTANGAPPVGPLVLVSGAANTTGLIVRTGVLYSIAGGGISLEIGGQSVAFSGGGTIWVLSGGGMLVPIGQALSVTVIATTGHSYNLSWDVV